MGLAMLVHVKAVNDQRLAILRYFGPGCWLDPGGDLHAQVFVQVRKWQ